MLLHSLADNDDDLGDRDTSVADGNGDGDGDGQHGHGNTESELCKLPLDEVFIQYSTIYSENSHVKNKNQYHMAWFRQNCVE